MVDQLSPQVNVVDQHMDLAPLFDRLLEAVDVTKLAVNGGEVVRMLLFYGRRVTHAVFHAATHAATHPITHIRSSGALQLCKRCCLTYAPASLQF